jgi:hypothetical protein
MATHAAAARMSVHAKASRAGRSSSTCTRAATHTREAPVRSEDKLHFHDARGTFATMAFELGVLTVREIAEMLAWSEDRVERIINRYVRRDAILRAKIERMDRALANDTGTPVENRVENQPDR